VFQKSIYLTRCALSRRSIVLTDIILFSGMCDVTTNGVTALAVAMETDPVSDVPLCLFIFILHTLYFISLMRDFQNKSFLHDRIPWCNVLLRVIGFLMVCCLKSVFLKFVAWYFLIVVGLIMDKEDNCKYFQNSSLYP
jgi:hypothetical protein